MLLCVSWTGLTAAWSSGPRGLHENQPRWARSSASPAPQLAYSSASTGPGRVPLPWTLQSRAAGAGRGKAAALKWLAALGVFNSSQDAWGGVYAGIPLTASLPVDCLEDGAMGTGSRSPGTTFSAGCSDRASCHGIPGRFGNNCLYGHQEPSQSSLDPSYCYGCYQPLYCRLASPRDGSPQAPAVILSLFSPLNSSKDKPDSDSHH